MPVMKETLVRAPRFLGAFQDYLPGTVNFIGRTRRAIARCKPGHRVVVDFSGCAFVSRSACLVITAELERSRRLCGGKVAFIPPIDDEMADLFDAFGVYEYFKIPSPLTPGQKRMRTKNSMVVRSGDAAVPDVKYKLAEVAAVALKVCGDDRLAKLVEEALQEAMWNAAEHAYAGMDEQLLPPSKWWFAGLYDPQAKEAFFYALDHGQGIPRRARSTMKADVEAYFAADDRPMTVEQASDKDLLVAAIRAPRLDLVGRQGRGKGLPTMVSLVDHSIDGEMRIISGAGAWKERRKKAAGKGSKAVDRCYPLEREFPGTLIAWRVSGPLE